jgi:hypothetical protein
MTASIDEHRRLLAEALARADSDIGELRVRVADGERLAAELAAVQRQLAAELAAVQRQLAESRAECTQLRIDLGGVMGSLSWRATAPARLAAARVRALRGRG